MEQIYKRSVSRVVWPKKCPGLRVGFGGPKCCAVSAVCSAKQPRIVLFMFKHCFCYDFPIGFVCGSWVRLRKYLMRNRAGPLGRLPTGDGSVRWVRLAKTPCAVSRARSAEQPSIVLFMFKHYFDYDFTIGFVCGSWVRLRKASLSVGFVWLMRNRAAPKGSSAALSCGHRSLALGRLRTAAAAAIRAACFASGFADHAGSPKLGVFLFCS
jgi:hypothetical protein